ncbi:MAG: serine/threonine-protein kinase [Myxococcota bacterium]
MDSGALSARYEHLRALGRGSFGEVSLARDRESGESVALKVLHTRDPWALEGFKNEARFLADEAHPAFVVPDEIVAGDGTLALVMPFVDGRPFTDVLAEAMAPSASGVVDDARARLLVARLVAAVGALHERGVLHLDLKPQNVLVTASDEVCILDFGLSRLRPDRGAVAAADVVGSPVFMAPEQLSLGDLTPATDLYAVGVMLFVAFTGRAPFDASLGPLASLLVPAPALGERRPDLAAPWPELCAGLLATEPAQRASAAEALAWLQVEPALPNASARPVFIGRERELARLRDVQLGVAGGLPAVALLGGAPGIGKTALARRFIAGAVELGALAVWGRCFAGEAIPFKALDAALDSICALVRALPDLAREVAADASYDALCRVFPVFGTLAGALGAGATAPEAAPTVADPARARALLRRVVQRLGADRPLLIVIDDAHWGDSDALDVLMALLEPPDAPRLMLLLTHRSDGPDAVEGAWTGSAFGAAFERRVRKGVGFELARIELSALGDDDARELTSRALGIAPGDARVASLVALGGGSPLLLSQLLADPTHAEGAGVDAASVIVRSLADFEEPIRRFVTFVALAGRPLPVAWIAEAAGVPVPSRRALRELCARRSCGRLRPA